MARYKFSLNAQILGVRVQEGTGKKGPYRMAVVDAYSSSGPIDFPVFDAIDEVAFRKVIGSEVVLDCEIWEGIGGRFGKKFDLQSVIDSPVRAVK